MPHTLVYKDGKIDEEVLKKIDINKNWLLNEIYRQGVELNNIFYAFYKNKKLYIIEQDKIN